MLTRFATLREAISLGNIERKPWRNRKKVQKLPQKSWFRLIEFMTLGLEYRNTSGCINKLEPR